MSTRLSLSWLAAAVTVLLSAASASASNSRNAPTIDNFSAVDIADLYLFRDPSGCNPNSAGCNLVVILTVQPLADPSFGLTYHFEPNAIYRINFSTTPDAISKGIASANIDFVFSPFGNDDSTCPAPNPPCQTYQATFPNGVVVNGLTTRGSAGGTPNLPVVTNFPLSNGQISIFAGPREDPFFFDYVGLQRFLADFNGQPTPVVPHFNLFTGKDAFLGKNVNAISVEFPVQMILPAGMTKLATWAETYLSKSLRPRGKKDDDDHGHHFFQVDRIGNPLVNWSLIPPQLNDAFDFSQPRGDAQDFAPSIAGNLIRYGVDQAHVLPVLATAVIPDTLKFDTNLPDGYLQVPPNGRRLTDRATDFLMSLFFNVQGGPGTQHPGAVTCPQLAQTAFSDCTSPKVPLSVFPFIGPPLQPTP